jgi:hypothetical protein
LATPENAKPDATEDLRPTVNWPPPSVADVLKQRQAETASKLAAWLLGILAGGLILHYTCVMILIWFKKDEGIKVIEDAFHSWLPFVAGLAGAAVAYYFTKESK